jgi:outer membrane protein
MFIVLPVTLASCMRMGMLGLALGTTSSCLADDALLAIPGRTDVQTLWSVYATAHAISPAEISARSDFVAQQEAVPQARAALLPKLSATISDAHDSADLNTGREETYPSKGYTISLRQQLFDAPDWQAYRQAKAGAERAGKEYDATEQLLMLQVCESYFAVLAAQDDLRFATHHAVVLGDQRELTQRRYEQGDATIVDVQESEAELERAKADVLTAENALREWRADLRRRAGQAVGRLAILPDSADLETFRESDEDGWVDRAMTHSPDVAQQCLTRYIAELEVKKSRDAFLPTVSVTLSHSVGNLEYLNDQVSISTGGNANSFRQGSTNVAMLQVSIPIFDGLSTLSRERQAQAERDKADADLESARLDAQTREQQIYLDLDSAFARARTLNEALKSGKLAMESNRAAYAVGLRINSDVLRAEDSVYSTERDLAHSRYDIVLNHLRLRANAGELTEGDLHVVDALLAPAEADNSGDLIGHTK